MSRARERTRVSHAPEDSPLIVGADVGGTKTLVWVSTPGHEVVAEALCESGDWWAAPEAQRATYISDLVTGTVAQSGLSASHVRAIAVGAHEYESPDECLRLSRRIERLCSSPTLVVNDAQLLGPAAGLPSAVQVVAGTGSIAYGTTPEGEVLHAGGWGWLLGDEAGATGLVREAVRALSRSHDEAQRTDALLPLLLESMQVADIHGMRGALMSGDPVAWAGRAPLVFAAADDGSPLAIHVIERAARSLADLVLILAKRGAVARHVVAGGGVIRRQPRLIESFRAALHSVLPGTRLQLLDDPPVRGAVRLAESLLRTGTRNTLAS